MAERTEGTELVHSVLDRLMSGPGAAAPESRSHAQMLRDLRASVMRDVSSLLNTRRRHRPIPEGLEELAPSNVDYGIPDFTGMQFSSADAREELRNQIEAILRTYEPRFKRVRVQLLDNADKTDRSLRFRIDALLHAEPAPEPIVFDSVVEPVRGSFEVEGGADG